MFGGYEVIKTTSGIFDLVQLDRIDNKCDKTRRSPFFTIQTVITWYQEKRRLDFKFDFTTTTDDKHDKTQCAFGILPFFTMDRW